MSIKFHFFYGLTPFLEVQIVSLLDKNHEKPDELAGGRPYHVQASQGREVIVLEIPTRSCPMSGVSCYGNRYKLRLDGPFEHRLNLPTFETRIV